MKIIRRGIKEKKSCKCRCYVCSSLLKVDKKDFKSYFGTYFGAYCYICPVCKQLNIKGKEELLESGIIFKGEEKNGK
nr:MAG TPA: hypothetical protein [Caudoviricetes sp.]